MNPDSATPRILITRLSHIGDCVLTMPLLCALRQALPNAYIAWAVESPSYQLLEGHTALDEIIKIPKGWLKSLGKFWEVRRTLREKRFDLVFDPQSLTKSSALGWVSGCKRRVGLAGPDGRELAPYLANERIHATQEHIVPRSLELLRVLGVKRPEVEFKVPLHESAMDSMQKFVLHERLASGFAVINPSASWASKRWELDRFADVAQQLRARHGLRSVVVWAGADERAMAEQVVGASSGSAIVAPPTNLKELAALSTLSRLFVSSDSGPLHLAAAVGTPVVGLYGVTRPAACGAYGPVARNVQAFYQDGTARQRRSADNTALRAITVSMVSEACEQVLGLVPTKARSAA